MKSPLFEPGEIGGLEIHNRFVRASTSETMAGQSGEVTPDLIDVYDRLGRNEVGLILTGHLYCHPRGRYAPRQTGIHEDSLIAGLAKLAAAAQRHGSRIFAELAHAGSQCRIRGLDPVAPSPVPNALTGRVVAEATEGEIDETISAFASAAARAVEAGFDGVHIHAANGYPISEFSSPLTNRRADRWGGGPAARGRFALETVRAVRAAVPDDFPVTIKLGLADGPEEGLQLDESVPRARALVESGADAIEISSGVTEGYTDCLQYVAVDRRRALEDLLIHRLPAKPRPEAYFRPWAEDVRGAVDTRIILVGGMRRTETMTQVLTDGTADFVAMSRPFIREPDIVHQIANGRTGQVDCTSCNLCLLHEGHHSIQCWRTPRRRLVHHAIYRLRGGLRRGILRMRH